MDLVRGIVMILMALDHSRDFFGMPGDNPTNLAKASAALFLTRFVTHLCAPTFFLLTGLGASLMARRRSIPDVSRFLIARGIWLIILEVVVLRCAAYQFNIDYRITLLMILWALGWSMIVLGGLVRLGSTAAGVFGLVLIVAHNAFDGIRGAGPLWSILHVQSPALDVNGHVFFVAYPLVPWVGVTAIGYALGALYGTGFDDVRRRAWLMRGGLCMIGVFVVLRWLNVYGDPSPWSTDARPVFTALSFLNTTKYPPSLLFLLMTLGPAGVLLALAERETPSAWKPVITLGRVPLFYYALHFFALHLLAWAVAVARYGTGHWMFESPDLAHYPFSPPPGWGYSLPIVYIVWLSIVTGIYPLCAWFERLKQRHPGGVLSYL